MSVEKPIIFSAESVATILRGDKTQTRRVMKPQPEWNKAPEYVAEFDHWRVLGSDGLYTFRQSLIKPGDRFWVREVHSYNFTGYDRALGRNYIEVSYRADNSFHKCYVDGADGENICDQVAQWIEDREVDGNGDNWRSPIFMPKWATRLWLEVTEVRAQRISPMSGHDLIAEGYPLYSEFAIAWDNLNAKRGFPFSGNPWVWAYTFKVIEHEQQT